MDGGRAAEDESFDDAFADELPVVHAERGGDAAAAGSEAASGGGAPAALPSTDGAVGRPSKPLESEENEETAAFVAWFWERLEALGERAGVSPRDDVPAFLEAVMSVPLSSSEREVVRGDLKVLRALSRPLGLPTSSSSS